MVYSKQAEVLMKQWVANSTRVVAATFPCINVHLLGHLFDDFRKFGDLMRISAFKYENQSGIIKKMVKNNNNPLITVQKRKIAPSLMTVIKPCFSVGRDGYVLVTSRRYGRCLGIIRLVTDSNVKPLCNIDGDDFLKELSTHF